jgi:hypothetical protein
MYLQCYGRHAFVRNSDLSRAGRKASSLAMQQACHPLYGEQSRDKINTLYNTGFMRRFRFKLDTLYYL